MNILQTSSPHFNERSTSIDTIVIHYTDMISAELALAWLRHPASRVSAHYLIDEKGCIYQMVNEEQRAWHAGESFWQGHRNLNDRSIGIELANPGHSHGYRSFSEAQIEKLIHLCVMLKARWNIPTSRILGHSDIAPQRKQDPGHLFPWKKLAKEGLGCWPISLGITSSSCRQPQMRTEDLDLIVPMLSKIGYETASPRHALLAFQRHFQPHKLYSLADQETYNLLKDLLKSQEMLI